VASPHSPWQVMSVWGWVRVYMSVSVWMRVHVSVSVWLRVDMSVSVRMRVYISPQSVTWTCLCLCECVCICECAWVVRACVRACTHVLCSWYAVNNKWIHLSITITLIIPFITLVFDFNIIDTHALARDFRWILYGYTYQQLLLLLHHLSNY